MSTQECAECQGEVEHDENAVMCLRCDGPICESCQNEQDDIDSGAPVCYGCGRE